MNEEPILTSPAKVLSARGNHAAEEARNLPRIRNLIAVGSGKGGVGKTWFSITLSQALALAGDRVLLVDGDLGLANVDVQLAMGPERDLASVVTGRVKLSDAITPFDGGAGAMESENSARAGRPLRGFDVLAGRSGSGTLDGMNRNQIAVLCRELCKLSVLYDHVIVDLAAGMNTHMMPIFQQIGRVLIVVTDDPTSITDAYAFLKSLVTRFPNIDIEIVVNRAESDKGAEKTYGAVKRASEHFLQFCPQLRGTIRSDKSVANAIRAQAPLLTRHPQSIAAENVRKIAAGLRPKSPRGLI